MEAKEILQDIVFVLLYGSVIGLSIYAIALYASIILYMVFAVRNYGRWLRDNYADLENLDLGSAYWHNNGYEDEDRRVRACLAF